MPAKLRNTRMAGLIGNCAGTSVTLALIAGCVPYVSSYDRIEAPNAKQFSYECTLATGGGPSIAYFPFHGIYLSVGMEPLRLGLHLPEGTTAMLMSDTITISGSTKSGPIQIHTHLKAVPHGSLGRDPDEFDNQTDPFRPDLGLGPMAGASRNGRYTWYFYIGIDEKKGQNSALAVPHASYGTIELPPININGQNYPSQIIPFTLHQYAGLQPVNC